MNFTYLVLCLILGLAATIALAVQDVTQESKAEYNWSDDQLQKRQGYYQVDPYARQDGLVTSIPLVAALAIGGLVAGIAAVQNANEARNNLRSQLNTLNSKISTANNNIASVTSSLSPLSTSVVSTAAKTPAACSGLATIASLDSALVINDLSLKTVIEGLITIAKNSECPT